MLDDYVLAICCAIGGKKIKRLAICLGFSLSMIATVSTPDARPMLCPAEGQIASIPASMCARRLSRGVKCWEGSMKSLLLANSHARGFDAHARRRRISARARDRRASIALPH